VNIEELRERLEDWIYEKKLRRKAYLTSFRKFWWEIKSHYHGPEVEPQIQENGIKIRWNFRNTLAIGGGISKSFCDVEILPRKYGQFVVIFTELGTNKGQSAMNAYEDLATVLYHERLRYVPLEKIEWYLHLPATRSGFTEHFTQVTMSWDGRGFSDPQWGRVRREHVYAGTHLLSVLRGI